MQKDNRPKIEILTLMNLQNRELLTLFNVDALANSSKIGMDAIILFLTLSAVASTLLRNSTIFLVDSVFPEPDSPVMKIVCEVLDSHICRSAWLAKKIVSIAQ